MREALIGILTAVAAVTTWILLRPHPAAGLPPAVWQVSTGQVVHADDTRDLPPPRPTSAPRTSTTAPTRPRSENEIKTLLHNKRFDRLDFKQAPLVEVIRFFRDSTGLNFWVNWRALEAAGVTSDQPITLQLTNVRASKALQMILDDAGGGNVLLRYRAYDEIVTISTSDDLWRDTVTRVYNVRDLLLNAPKFANTFHENIPDFMPRTSRPYVGAVPATPSTESDIASLLVQIVQETVDPTSWRDAGGSIGAVRYFAGLLIVTQTPENHENLETLLAQIREELSK